MIISATPLRVSIIGGGTDLPEWFIKNTGCVVGSSIDKYVYVIVNKRFDDKIYVGYTKQEIVDSVDEIQHDLIREAAKAAGLTKGFEVKTMSDVPSAGSGLGSSSAYLVGLLNAFYHYKNKPKENKLLAYEAFVIERYYLNRSVGMQDHLLCGLGGQNRITFTDDLPTWEEIELRKDNLFMHYTGITRNANDILKQQVLSVEEKYSYYAELSDKAIQFEQSNLETILKAGWEIKKALSPDISNEAIEQMIGVASGGGATAWKILGAGGGGFLLSYVPKENQERFSLAMRDYKEMPFAFTNYGTRIIYNGL